MNKRILFFLFVLSACNHPQKRDSDMAFRALRGLLPTANWQMTNSEDTSYVYFSSQFDESLKVYEYRLIRGDSVVTCEGNISISADSVLWSWNHHLLFLLDADEKKANWRDKGSGENYVLEKINDSSLQFRSSSIFLNLKKTLPLSTFLVRSKYDYEHGTMLADSAEIPPRKTQKLKSGK
jgi:hypothetical protein